MSGHNPKAVLVQIMRGARVSREIIDAVKFFKCDHCAEVSNASSVARVKAPSLYSFNHELIVDIFYNHDMEGMLYGWLSIVCNGTTFHVITLVQIGKGQPTSIRCFEKFQSRWTHWAGFPNYLIADRGLHNRGEFAKGLKANGVVIRQAAFESPEMIGCGERRGGILKANMEAVMKAHHVIGKKQMKQVAAISTENKNDSMRKGGFTHRNG